MGVALGLVGISLPAAATVGASTPLGSGWSLAPTPNAGGGARSSIDLTVAGGQRATDRMVLSNDTTGPLAFIVYPADASEGEGSGAFALSLPNTPMHEVGHWTVTAVHSLSVPPREAVTFPFTLTVPVGTPPGDYAGGVVAIDVAHQTVGSGAVHLKVLSGVGVRIYLHVPGARHAGVAVEHLSATATVPPFAGIVGTGQARIRFMAVNTGNVIEVITARVDVVDGSGHTVKQFAPRVLPLVLPGVRVAVSEPPWVGLPLAGPQHVHVVLTGGGRRADATVQFWVVPWGLIPMVGMVVVAGAVLLVLWGRRRPRRRVPAEANSPGPSVPTQGGLLDIPPLGKDERGRLTTGILRSQ